MTTFNKRLTYGDVVGSLGGLNVQPTPKEGGGIAPPTSPTAETMPVTDGKRWFKNPIVWVLAIVLIVIFVNR